MIKKPVFPSREKIPQIAKDIKEKLGCGIVSITGGEPTTYPYLTELISELNKNGILTQLLTNGSLLTEEKINEYLNSGLKLIYFSVDHFNEKKVFENRRIPNLLDKIKKNVKLLKKTPILVQGGITISKNNKNDLEKILKFAIKIGIEEISFCLPIAKTNSTFKLGNDKYDIMNISDPEMADVMDQLIALKKKYRNKVVHQIAYLKEMKNFYLHKTQRFPCKAGEKIFYLDNRLNIYQCFLKTKNIGKIGGKITPLKNVVCYNCPLQCFREPSVYLSYNLFGLLLNYNKSSRKYYKIAGFMAKSFLKDLISKEK